jgi:hypothetical protein
MGWQVCVVRGQQGSVLQVGLKDDSNTQSSSGLQLLQSSNTGMPSKTLVAQSRSKAELA